ncbi:MAG: hypothetical protein IH932_04535 [Thaumarchaeota archaeon]|nr:hypothetical protein [Nitrososphaerota archaeon]
MGVSYILSVLVMTVVTVSLSSVVLFWALRTVDETQAGFTLDVQARMDRSRERMLIENVAFLNSTHITIYVRNVGNVQLIVDQVYIDNLAGTIEAAGGLSVSRLGLSIQRAGNVTIASPVTLVPGNTYSISVATSRGNTDVAFWTF